MRNKKVYFIKEVNVMAYVYLIGEADTKNSYKIGMTRKKNIEDRMKELQTGNSNELFIKSYFQTKYPSEMEKRLHHHYSNKHVLNEWYSLEKDDVKEFQNVCSQIEYQFDCLRDNPFFKRKATNLLG